MNAPKIYVTGLGVVSAAGLGVDALWQAVCDQTSATTSLYSANSLHAESVLMPVGAVPWATQPISGIIDAKTAKTTDRSFLLGRIALDEAMGDAGLTAHEWIDPSRVAVVVGSELAGVSCLEAFTSYLRSVEFSRPVRPRLATMTTSGVAGYYAEQIGAHGPSFVVSSACASSGYALGLARLLLLTGQVDYALVGGTEAPLTDTIVGAMIGLGALDPASSADPARACRPFDASRTGTVMAEGAGFLVLQADTVATPARPKAMLAGFGCGSDAYHRTAPHPEGRGAVSALTLALKSAEIDRFDHVNAHATATRLNDKIESYALATVVSSDTRVSATKGVHGHALAASAAIENVLAVRSIVENTIPGITNLNVVGDDISPIRLQRETAHHPVAAAANISVGFGGYNTAAVFTAV
ncbi:beta-ketoacyl-[acyl-carrier-protein] synthase family protein [Mycolicibacterium fortuitum]|uniref:beta-ketoacyl-[acyl-carrier-protein] synthase family protein n=1 Tax=Mycolicibacterium fortuitum TaxID=1766 RepID=UPI002629FE88|nr:beta-ketoacyl-[acyl-carrier-protein] synthase family protein [Mycolicibacterium fortuitum]